MGIIDNFLRRLPIGNEEEDPIAEKIRLSKNYIWLYHGTKEKYLESIRKRGLITTAMGRNMGAASWHPSGKRCLSYSTNKFYSMAYSRNMKEPLLAMVPTKTLWFGIGGNVTEYISIDNIPLNHILFPGDSNYKKIEQSCSYLKDKPI